MAPSDVLTGKLGVDSLLRHDDFFVFHCTSTYLCRRAFDRLVANSEPGGISLTEKIGFYKEKVEPGTLLTKQLGSTYTASCYVNLYSLFLNRYDDIVGKRICVYSFGSGATASMFRLRVRRPPESTGIRCSGSTGAYASTRRPSSSSPSGTPAHMPASLRAAMPGPSAGRCLLPLPRRRVGSAVLPLWPRRATGCRSDES